MGETSHPLLFQIISLYFEIWPQVTVYGTFYETRKKKVHIRLNLLTYSAGDIKKSDSSSKSLM